MFKELWEGNTRLWVVSLGYIAFVIIGAILAPIIILFLGILTRDADTVLRTSLIYLFILSLSSIWFVIVIWKCAFNTDWVVWGYIARVLAMLILIANILKLLGLSYQLMEGPSKWHEEIKNGTTKHSGFFDTNTAESPQAKPTCPQLMASYAQLLKMDPKEYALAHPDMEQQMADSGKCIRQ